MEHEEPIGLADADWDNRVLCSDGRCTGIIGPDGRCKECGAPYGESSEKDMPQGVPVAGVPVATDAGGAKEPPAAETDAEWENRVLCRDGNCIGVIGPGGRCRECGLPLLE